jgi:predicted aldo/keto reductase-like oxidoreductase
MNYRRFGRLDWMVSALGFGALRLPLTAPRASRRDEVNVDEAEAIRMIRYAIDHGVNYVDTGYPYHEGRSEVVVGKALRDGYRDKVKLSTKIAVRSIKSRQEQDRVFDEELSKLQTDHLDFYLLGGITEGQDSSWSRVKKRGLHDWAEKMVADGRIHYLGFSFHGRYDAFKDVIDDYEGWTFCYILYNYVDTESSDRTPGTRGIEYAAEKSLAVGVLEPIQGGNLATRSPVRPHESPIRPGEIQTLLDEAGIKRKPADLALQWVWNHPGVSVALSGMGAMNQVIENIESASRSPVKLTENELKFISRIREIGQSRLQQTQK